NYLQEQAHQEASGWVLDSFQYNETGAEDQTNQASASNSNGAFDQSSQQHNSWSVEESGAGSNIGFIIDDSSSQQAGSHRTSNNSGEIWQWDQSSMDHTVWHEEGSS